MDSWIFMRKKKELTIPSPEQLETELKRVRYKNRYRAVLRSTVYTLITVAAVSAAMVLFSAFAVNFSSIYYILICGALGVILYLAKRKGGAK
jgi:lipopolysaccharide export LptBFGC system permease protein LptF